MKIYPFHALIPDKSIIASPSSYASDVKHHFKNYMEQGYFKSRKQEELYIYQITLRGTSYSGIVSLMDIEELINKHVLPHEATLHHKVQSSMRIILEREAIIKPILLTYEPQKKLQDHLNNIIKNQKPIHRFKYKITDEVHKLWAITDESIIQQIIELFARQINKVYIADGHHRCEVLQRLYKDKRKKKNISYQKFVTVFFDFDNLNILDYNRLVDFGDQMTSLEFLVRLSHLGTLEPLKSAEKPARKFELTICIGQNWFKLIWHKKLLKKDGNAVILDAALLNKYVIEHVLGIKNVAIDEHIQYLEGNLTSNEIEHMVSRKPDTAAFCLYPVQMDEITKQANAGKVLPPKSTYFEPRLPNGFIAQSLSTAKPD